MPLRPPAVLERLQAALQGLPGIGKRSAERVANYLLQAPVEEAQALADAITQARAALHPCSLCGRLYDADPCDLCSDPERDATQLCVVATDRELYALAAAGVFPGRFHLLGGLISPLKGVGPGTLRLDALKARIISEGVREVVLALPPTTEGETTAYYVKELLPPDLPLTRLGIGVPLGADLDYLDAGTLERALNGRQKF